MGPINFLRHTCAEVVCNRVSLYSITVLKEGEPLVCPATSGPIEGAKLVQIDVDATDTASLPECWRLVPISHVHRMVPHRVSVFTNHKSLVLPLPLIHINTFHQWFIFAYDLELAFFRFHLPSRALEGAEKPSLPLHTLPTFATSWVTQSDGPNIMALREDIQLAGW